MTSCERTEVTLVSSVFQCKGCGETDSIVEVSLLPSIQTVRPDPAPNATPFEDVDYSVSDPVDFWEGAPVLGYACRNERCRFWHGSYGYPNDRDQEPVLMFETAPKLEDIATIV